MDDQPRGSEGSLEIIYVCALSMPNDTSIARRFSIGPIAFIGFTFLVDNSSELWRVPVVDLPKARVNSYAQFF